MFTGIIEEVGIVVSVEERASSRLLTIRASMLTSDMKVGDSVAVQGVCQTVIECDEGSFKVIAVEETLRKTTLGLLHRGSRVNIERALLVSSRLGGHIVQGHVESVGTIVAINALTSSWEIWIECPLAYMRYIVPLGSIALDGISLTVAETEMNRFKVAIIPHTWEKTTIRYCKIGDYVNLEFDILAKFVESLLIAYSRLG